MKKIKPVFKIAIGIAVLIFVIAMFFFIQRGGALESGNLQDWKSASIDSRSAAVKILIGSEENTELLVACVSKIASLPDSAQMSVRDATTLCHTGIQLKENL